ncbi:hypothetical protein ILP92_16440 [Maribius pontilimi]|uniref:Uncharacterized protein n=1 Tax=Palleronia pontilimi TaxID=1964209 RepID=A0A934IEU2_9RHOB|nr:hypothetical protein [Palleronia pontilimi]MBJ3764331.1 hypothetical protein [Palleronia pontilimi]
MITNDIIARTLSAASQARMMGFDATADALEELLAEMFEEQHRQTPARESKPRDRKLLSAS